MDVGELIDKLKHIPCNATIVLENRYEGGKDFGEIDFIEGYNKSTETFTIIIKPEERYIA